MTDEEIMQGLEAACDSATNTFGWTVPPYPILLDYIQRLKAENAELKEELNNVVGYCKEVEDYSNTRIKALEARLEKAIELPCIEPMTTYGWSDEAGVGKANFGIYYQLLYRDKGGELMAVPGLSKEEAEARLKGLRGGF